jgi:tripartite-type tricarboxylate transporter receptor subunit TctC
LLASSSYATNPTVLKLPFDPINDMTPVIELGVGPMVVTVNPTLPVHSFPDLVAYLKANPDTVPFGSTGIGGLVHLATVSFMLETHTKMIHVPYKGSSEIVPDLVSGRTKIFFADVGTVGKLIGTGQLRGLAVSGDQRLAEMQDVPTLAELGYKPYAFGLQVWQGMLAPKGTPAPIVDRLNSEINRIIRIDSVVRLFETQYYEPVGGPPENFGDLIRSDIQRWSTVAKAADVKVE